MAVDQLPMRFLGRTGVAVSSACLGTLTFGTETGSDEAKAIVDAFRDVGGNFIDTADVYGSGAAETIVGAAVRGARDDFVIATKARFRSGIGVNERGASRLHLVRAVEASLRRLGTDRLDLLYLHAWDPFVDVEETLAALELLVASGKILYVGLSNYTGWQLATTACEASRATRPVVAQGEYSLFERGVELEVLPCASAFGMGFVAWAPLAGGALTGKYHADPPPEVARAFDDSGHSGYLKRRLASERLRRCVDELSRVAALVGGGITAADLALAWTAAQPAVTSVALGARTRDQAVRNLAALATNWPHIDDIRPPDLDWWGYPYEFVSRTTNDGPPGATTSES